MAKPVLNLDQILHQLTTSWGGDNFGDMRFWAQKDMITYAIPDVAPPSLNNESLGFQRMTPVMQQQVRLAFELWDDLIEDSLTETASTGADITFALSTRAVTGGQPGAYAIAGEMVDRGEYDVVQDADIWMHPAFRQGRAASDLGFQFGRDGFETAVHEIGHSLGLSHPGRYNEDGSGQLRYETHAAYAQDTLQYTIMSYWDEGSDGSGADHGGWLASTPLLHDVMAIQALYGADMTTRTGDTTYGFHSTANRAVFDFTVNTNPVVCIWDAGGNDTLDLSGYGGTMVIDLEQGGFSSVMGLSKNLSIAYGCVIENAVGGAGADAISGNAAGNFIHGGAGHDGIAGLDGNDVLMGGIGNDVLAGGRGADIFAFANEHPGANGLDLVVDFEVGLDRVYLDDSFLGMGRDTLLQALRTEGHGWAWLDLPGADDVVFQGVSEAAMERYLDSSFAFF